MPTIRKVAGFPAVWSAIAELAALIADADWTANSATAVIIEDGTTDGYLATDGPSWYRINGQLHTKAGTDDLWNLSAETDTTGAQYRAYWLYLDASGAASFDAGSNAASEAAALAALPTPDADKAIMGVYVAGLSTDFNGAAGLAAQGTITLGVPASLAQTAEAITLVSP